MNEENNFTDIFNGEIVELNTVVQQCLQALPKIERMAQDPELKATVNQQFIHSRKEARNLGRIMDILGITDKCTCATVVDLQIDSPSLDKLHADYAVDARIICVAMKVEHYKLASYLSLCALAKMLGLSEIANLLKGAFPQISVLFKSRMPWCNSVRGQKTYAQAVLDGVALDSVGAGIDSN